MFATTLALALGFTPLLGILPIGSQPVNPVTVAQVEDPYSDWIDLYTDSFEDSQGNTITQSWLLNPSIQRTGETVRFTLLSKRSPVSSNGTAAGRFAYIANCGTVSYAIERITFLDEDNVEIDAHTYQSALENVDPESPLYPHLIAICNGEYSP
ncbi:MAG: hypothetical protein HC812_08555 [Leptolyngbya sp. RL_3_1]|nr:hypothetical protein [Leptolyngbya sp. RL_3_1]